MSQENIQAARRLYDAFNSGDLAAFQKGCAPTFVWNEAENSANSAGNPYRSFDDVLEGVFQPTMNDFEGFRVDLEKVFDAGDTIVGTGRYLGKHRKTGKQLSAQFCHLIHFDPQARLDGLQEYVDTLEEAVVAARVQIVEEMRIPQPVM